MPCASRADGRHALTLFCVRPVPWDWNAQPALEMFKANPNTGVGVITTSVLLAVGLLLFEYTPEADKLKQLSESFKSSFRRSLSTPREPTVEEPAGVSWLTPE
jgi:hypothetical protein